MNTNGMTEKEKGVRKRLSGNRGENAWPKWAEAGLQEVRRVRREGVWESKIVRGLGGKARETGVVGVEEKFGCLVMEVRK